MLMVMTFLAYAHFDWPMINLFRFFKRSVSINWPHEQRQRKQQKETKNWNSNKICTRTPQKVVKSYDLSMKISRSIFLKYDSSHTIQSDTILCAIWWHTQWIKNKNNNITNTCVVSKKKMIITGTPKMRSKNATTPHHLQLHYHMMISVLFYNCSITSIRFECIRRDDAASILYIFSCDRGIKYKRFVFNRKYRLFGVYN